MKRTAFCLLIVTLPLGAAESVNIMCGDTHCTMKNESMAKIIAYIRALEQLVVDLKTTTGCS